MQSNKSKIIINRNPNCNFTKFKIGNYILGTTIGKGNSAVVKIATHSLIKQKVAIKIFNKSGLDMEKQLRLRREIDSMKRLKHQNIIRLYEIMETTKLICLVTEYATNGELYDYIIHKKRLSEREARHIFKQIVAAVHYCHLNSIVHRDIKVENILLDNNWHVKLADFGFSNTYKQGELLNIYCGSPNYCAPEILCAELYDGPKVDIWSLGVVLYVLVCGYLPFEAQSFGILRSQIISGSYKIPFFLTEECKCLIKGMLALDPDKRFSIDDILNSKWFQIENDFPNNIVNSTQFRYDELTIYGEYKNLVEKIEQISIKELEPNQNVLYEISKYNQLNINDIIKSVRNNEFDSNAGIYYLIEAKLLMNISKNYSLNENNPFQPIKNSTHENEKLIKIKFEIPEVNHLYSDFENNKKEKSLSNISDKSNQEPSSNYSGDQENFDNDGTVIEEMGRDYLSRFNAIRRHTIGTNVENSNNFMIQSKECFNENKTLNSPNFLKLRMNSDKFNENNSLSNIFTIDAENFIIKNSTLKENKYLLDFQNSEDLDHFDDLMQLKSFDQKFKTKFDENENCFSLLEENTVKLQHSNLFNSKNIAQNLFKKTSNNSNFIQFSNQNCLNSNYQSEQEATISHSFVPFLHSGRRASDGGSNICLFNQFYSLKNFYSNRPNKFNSSNEKECNEDQMIENMDEKLIEKYNDKPRGSITSGIPIFSSSSQVTTGLSPDSPISNTSSVTFISSEDEEINLNPTNLYKNTRRNSRSRHEPYIMNSAINCNTSNSNSNFAIHNQLNPPVKLRQRENSFSGSYSPQNYLEKNNRNHRRSAPNPLDLILTNRVHLEHIYYQSLNKANVHQTKELKELILLQQENPVVDEWKRQELQEQHKNLIINLNQSRTQKENTKNFSYDNIEKIDEIEIFEAHNQTENQKNYLGNTNKSLFILPNLSFQSKKHSNLIKQSSEIDSLTHNSELLESSELSESKINEIDSKTVFSVPNNVNNSLLKNSEISSSTNHNNLINSNIVPILQMIKEEQNELQVPLSQNLFSTCSSRSYFLKSKKSNDDQSYNKIIELEKNEEEKNSVFKRRNLIKHNEKNKIHQDILKNIEYKNTLKKKKSTNDNVTNMKSKKNILNQSMLAVNKLKNNIFPVVLPEKDSLIIKNNSLIAEFSNNFQSVNQNSENS